MGKQNTEITYQLSPVSGCYGEGITPEKIESIVKDYYKGAGDIRPFFLKNMIGTFIKLKTTLNDTETGEYIDLERSVTGKSWGYIIGLAKVYPEVLNDVLNINRMIDNLPLQIIHTKESKHWVLAHNYKPIKTETTYDFEALPTIRGGGKFKFFVKK